MNDTHVTESFTAAIHDALGAADDSYSIARIKSLPAGELARLDSRAQIRVTQYFNHTYIPDFVLTWSSGAVREREVFLRFAQTGPAFERDLARIGPREPTVFALERLNTAADEQADLHAVSRDAGALILDQSGLAPVAEAVKHGDAFVGLCASAVARTGRGL